MTGAKCIEFGMQPYEYVQDIGLLRDAITGVLMLVLCHNNPELT